MNFKSMGFYFYTRVRRVFVKPFKRFLRTSWPWTLLHWHYNTLNFINPVPGSTNERCWCIKKSNLRAVYDQVVQCKNMLPPLVCDIYLKQRKVIYFSLFGRVEVHTRQPFGPLSEARWFAEWDGRTLQFTGQPHWCIQMEWAVERALFWVIATINDHMLTRKQKRVRATRCHLSWALYH